MVINVYQTDEDIPNCCCSVFRSLVQEYVTNAAKAKRTVKKQTKITHWKIFTNKKQSNLNIVSKISQHLNVEKRQQLVKQSLK